MVLTGSWGAGGWAQKGLSNLAAHGIPKPTPRLLFSFCPLFPPFLRELRLDNEVGQFLHLPGQAVVGSGEDICYGRFKERMLRIRACLKSQRIVFSSWPPLRFLDSSSFEDSSRVALMAKRPLLPLLAFGRHLESTMTLLSSMCFSLYFGDVHFVEIKKRSCFCCFPLKEGWGLAGGCLLVSSQMSWMNCTGGRPFIQMSTPPLRVQWIGPN